MGSHHENDPRMYQLVLILGRRGEDSAGRPWNSREVNSEIDKNLIRAWCDASTKAEKETDIAMRAKGDTIILEAPELMES